MGRGWERERDLTTGRRCPASGGFLDPPRLPSSRASLRGSASGQLLGKLWGLDPWKLLLFSEDGAPSLGLGFPSQPGTWHLWKPGRLF